MRKTIILGAALALAMSCTTNNKNIEYTANAEQPFFNISEITAETNMKTVFGATPVFDTYEDGEGVLEFDQDVRMIGEGAFANCAPLVSIKVPETATAIGSYAFFNCKSLEKVVLPEIVERIGNSAFLSCKNLKEVHIKALTPPAVVIYADSRWDAFEGNSAALKIYVPKKALAAYQSAEGWKDYADRIIGE